MLDAAQTDPKLAKISAGTTPLHCACRCGYNGAIAKHPDTSPSSIVKTSARPVNCYVEVINVLLQAGADVNAADDYSYTPLHLAAQGNFTEAFSTLLRNGANAFLIDWLNRSPMKLGNPSTKGLLNTLVSNEELDIVFRIGQQHGAGAAGRGGNSSSGGVVVNAPSRASGTISLSTSATVSTAKTSAGRTERNKKLPR
jgi:hypothetical protein